MIEVKNLQKTYRSHGQTVGLLGADFTVPDGQIVGVLGENGAGKTTMLRCIAGLLPHKGTALLDGRPAGEQYGRISYITGEGSYYPALTVAAYGQLHGDSGALGDGVQGNDHVIFGVDLNSDGHNKTISLI